MSVGVLDYLAHLGVHVVLSHGSLQQSSAQLPHPAALSSEVRDVLGGLHHLLVC
jgi:hypothetical protein